MQRYLVSTNENNFATLTAAADEAEATEAALKLFGDNLLTIAALRRTKRIENNYASVVVQTAMEFYAKALAACLGK